MKNRLFHFVGVWFFTSSVATAQNRTITNGNFEAPAITNNTASQYFTSDNATSGTQVKGWHTTSPDFRIELRTKTATTGETSPSGSQHAEVNAVQGGTRLYQNVCLLNGEFFNYSYYHRGGKGRDIMKAKLYGTTVPSDSMVLKTSSTDGLTWQLYSETNRLVSLPTGVYQFSFETVSTFDNVAFEGNLLDDVKLDLAPLVTFSKATYGATENAVEVPVIKVNGTVPGAGMDIKLGVTSLSAVEGLDYSIVRTLHVPPGAYNLDNNFPVPLTILNDNFKEYDENIQFTIVSVNNGGRIHSGCGGSVVATYTIVDDDALEAGPDVTVCAGDTLTLTATGSQQPKWNRGAKQGIPFRAPNVAGDYIYTLYDSTQTNYSNNLLVNGDFSAGNTGFFVDPRYTYNPNYDPNFSTFHLTTNQYSLLPNPKGTNPNFYNMTDHSGTNPSSMLIVDGFAYPDVTFWSQTIPVVPYTNYRFTAWFASIGAGPPATIQMYINGAVLGPSLPIPENGSWVPYVYTWNSGISTSAVIRAVDLNILALDNDFAMDDVYFGSVSPFKDSLKVTVNHPPLPVVQHVDTCQQGLDFTLSAIGTALQWYDDTLAVSVGSNTPPIISFSQADTLSKWVTQTVNGCQSNRAEIKIHVKKLPVVPTFTDLDSCQKTRFHTLTANGSNLKWYADTTVAGSATAPVLDFSISDTVSKWVSQSVNGCESKKAEMKIRVRKTPLAPLTSPINECQHLGSLTLTAMGTQLKWYDDTTTMGSPMAPILDVGMADTLSKWVSQSLNGCESKKSELKISIRKTPAAPTTRDTVLCQQTGTVTLFASGASLTWYDAASTGNVILPTFPASIATNASYWVSQRLNGCESPRAKSTLTIHPTPPSPTIPNVDYCQKALAKPLTDRTDSLFWYTSALGGTKSSVIPLPNTQTIGITNFWVSKVEKGCESVRSQVIATVHTLPKVVITGTLAGSYCAKAPLSLQANGATHYDWTLPSGSQVTTATLFISSFSSAEAGKYMLTGRDANQCTARDSLILTLKNPPSISVTPLEVCEKQPISIQATTTGSAYWKLPANRVQNSSRLYLPVSAYSDKGRYVVVSSQNGCTDSSEVIVNVINCAPVAKDDHYLLYTDEKLVVDLSNHPLGNDTDPNDLLLGEDFVIVSTPRYGQLVVDANGNWTYTVNSELEAVEMLEYKICDRGQPSLCANAKMEIEIKKREMFFPDAFTPNGDGINDTYTVYHLSPQVKVSLTVYNRWGDQVYHNTDYKNDWKGNCTNGLCEGGQLPVGTYFIVAELSNGTKHTSYLTLNR